MGISIEGIEETLNRLTRVHKRTSESQLEALKKGAEDIEALSKDNAPRDTGALEKAIKHTMVRDDVRGRYSAYIGVDKRELGEGYAKYGFRYDEHLHENEFNLGEGSKAKADDGKAVGSRYLARALEELESDISKKMEEIAKREALNK